MTSAPSPELPLVRASLHEPGTVVLIGPNRPVANVPVRERL